MGAGRCLILTMDRYIFLLRWSRRRFMLVLSAQFALFGCALIRSCEFSCLGCKYEGAHDNPRRRSENVRGARRRGFALTRRARPPRPRRCADLVLLARVGPAGDHASRWLGPQRQLAVSGSGAARR